MALFKVNTGCREELPAMGMGDTHAGTGRQRVSDPARFGGRPERSGVKNKADRMVVLNYVAKSVVEAQRGQVSRVGRSGGGCARPDWRSRTGRPCSTNSIGSYANDQHGVRPPRDTDAFTNRHQHQVAFFNCPTVE